MVRRWHESDREGLDAAWNPIVPRAGAAEPPVLGDQTTECLRCHGPFSMRSGTLHLFQHRSGNRGHLCLPCLDQLNDARVAVGLHAFPVPLLGYRGPELHTWPRHLSEEAWATEGDGRRLLQFAAHRIPHQHLGLVLTSAALTLCPGLAEEPRFAFGIATLRAWCHGEADSRELERVYPLTPGEALDEPVALVYALRALGDAICFLLFLASIAPRGVSAFFPGNQAVDVVELLLNAAVEDANERGVLARDTRDLLLEGCARLIRAQVPFPHEVSTRWERSPGLAVTGSAVLRIDGWGIGDAVSIDDFPLLSGERAVAFDAAQVGRALGSS